MRLELHTQYLREREVFRVTSDCAARIKTGKNKCS